MDMRTPEEQSLVPKIVLESGLLDSGVEEAVELFCPPLMSCLSQHPGAGSCRERVGVEPALGAHAFNL